MRSVFQLSNKINTRRFVKALGLMVMLHLSVSVTLAEPVTLNLKDADINAVINTVSEVTGKNFIVDPRVKGRVNIISSRPMDQREVYQVFLSILDVHGFSAVPSGNIIKILPNASAKQGALPLASNNEPGTGDELVTRVIELSNVSAAQLVPILRPLVPQQGHLAAYASSNILIVSDSAANIRRLVKIIDRIDTPSNDSIEIISLEHASASDVVRILNALEKQNKANQAEEVPVLIADERTKRARRGGSVRARHSGGPLRARPHEPARRPRADLGFPRDTRDLLAQLRRLSQQPDGLALVQQRCADLLARGPRRGRG